MAKGKHVASISITAEPQGYAVWREVKGELKLEAHGLTWEVAKSKAEAIVREYKPSFSEV